MSDAIEYRRGAKRFAASGREWVPASDYDSLRDVAETVLAIAEGSSSLNSLPNIAKILRKALGVPTETRDPPPYGPPFTDDVP